MFDSVGSALDSASQMLAGGAAGAGTAADVKAEYTRGVNLDEGSAAEAGGSHAANLDNTHDGGVVIELIHHGFVHTTKSDKFAHPSRKDDDPKEMAEGERPLAIQFRAALERGA